MLRHQRLTLLVAVATLALTVVLYVVVPKGFFPVQDTGAIQVITEAPQSVSFAAMAERQQARGERHPRRSPTSTGLSSFIGVDGGNATLNSGRMLVTLAPRDERTRTATEIIAALRERVARVPGITVYLQPVQDLTIEDRVSRTQFQFILEDPDANAWASGCRSWSSGCGRRPSSPTSPATCRTAASRRSSTSTATPPAASASASRPSTTRSTMRSASG